MTKDITQTKVNGSISVSLPSGTFSIGLSNVVVGEVVAVLHMFLSALEQGQDAELDLEHFSMEVSHEP